MDLVPRMCHSTLSTDSLLRQAGPPPARPLAFCEDTKAAHSELQAMALARTRHGDEPTNDESGASSVAFPEQEEGWAGAWSFFSEPDERGERDAAQGPSPGVR